MLLERHCQKEVAFVVMVIFYQFYVITFVPKFKINSVKIYLIVTTGYCDQNFVYIGRFGLLFHCISLIRTIITF
jgi:hypothetical protein